MTPRTGLEAADELEAFASFYGALAAREHLGDHVCLAARPAEANGSVDELIGRGVDATAEVTGRWAEEIANAVADRSSEGSILTALGSLDLNLEPFAKIVEHEILHGAMLGALDSEWERDHDEEIAPERFAAAAPFAEGAFSSLPYADAVRLFNDKQVLPKPAFDALEKGAKRTAFTVARMASAEMLSVTKAELARMLNEARRKPSQRDDGSWLNPGANFRDFKKFAAARLESAGWTPANKSHVETIYRTQIATGYSSGRFVEMRKPEVLALLPYWQIRGVNDDRARPTHKAAFGIVLPANHPFWKHAYPPFGFSCRCKCIARTAAWLKRNGVSVGPVPKDLPDPGFESGTSKLISVPDAALEPAKPAAPAAPPMPVHPPWLHPPVPPESPASAPIAPARAAPRAPLQPTSPIAPEVLAEAAPTDAAKEAAAASPSPLVRDADKFGRGLVRGKGKSAREVLRAQVEHFAPGATSKDLARRREDRNVLATEHAAFFEAVGNADAEAWHDSAGQIVIREDVRDRALKAAKWLEEGWLSDPRLGTMTLDETLGAAGKNAFAQAITTGEGNVSNSLDGLRIVVHEELHGFSRSTPQSYRGIGELLEEVGTELNARHVVQNLTPEIGKNPYLRWQFSSTGLGSYQTDIDAVCDVVAKHAGITREAAGHLIREAHARSALTAGEGFSTPEAHLEAFLGALDVSVERAQLISRELLDLL